MSAPIEFAETPTVDLLDRLDGFVVEIHRADGSTIVGELGRVNYGTATIYQDGNEPLQVDVTKVKKVVVR